MRLTVLAILLNILALSAIFICIVVWKFGVENGYSETAYKYLRDAPEYGSKTTNMVDASSSAGVGYTSSLRWDEPANIDVPPADWSFKPPKYCKVEVDDEEASSSPTYDDKNQFIIVHFHMQHNAGTEFWSFVRQFTPCATRACWQTSKHCMVSYNEEVEAENIRQNYIKYGVQYVSYEFMLPPRMSLPFVSAVARRGLFFTTIVRNPFKRFLTYIRRYGEFAGGKMISSGRSPFWVDLQDRQRIYAGDNLNARWLSGAKGTIGYDQVNIAKCRLQLFDLVISDDLYEYAVKKVMCPLNNWKGGMPNGKMLCDDMISNVEHKSKPDFMNETDPILLGAWIERLRPSFEIYDYARILSWKQLQERDVKDLPPLAGIPSYMETMTKYTNIEISDSHFHTIKRVDLSNEDHFHPPVEFCNKMKQIWTSNPDEIPNYAGIGAITNRIHPSSLETRILPTR